MQRTSRHVITLVAALGAAGCTDAATSVAPRPQVASSAAALDPLAASTVAISAGGEGWEAAAAIDGAGNSVAVWLQRTISPPIDRIWSRSRPANGQWSAPSTLSGALQTVEALPAVRMTTNGAATAVWSDAGGIWTADRSPTGSWSPAPLIVSGTSLTHPTFVMNAQGDAAVLWGSAIVLAQPTQLNARRRTAGGAWGAPEVVATGRFVAFNGAAIAENTGELAATWERFDVKNCPYCVNFDFVLHVSRVARGSSAWQDSGPLTSPTVHSHSARAAIDPAGHAAAVHLTNFSTLVSINQASAGAGWSPPVTLYKTPSMLLSGFEIDLTGRATVALLDIRGSKVIAINGSIVSNTWGPAVNVSSGDPSPSQIVFALGTSGAGVLSWASGGPSQSAPLIRVSTRRSSTAAWSAPRTISPAGVQSASPEAADVNAAGKGIVIFSAYSASFTTHTEYATTN
jgi:hypothetical protein